MPSRAAHGSLRKEPLIETDSRTHLNPLVITHLGLERFHVAAVAPPTCVVALAD